MDRLTLYSLHVYNVEQDHRNKNDSFCKPVVPKRAPWLQGARVSLLTLSGNKSGSRSNRHSLWKRKFLTISSLGI